jgi:hypothetical protein
MAAAKSKILAARQQKAAFARGVRECADMLISMVDKAEYSLGASSRANRSQNNVVRVRVGRILMKGNSNELNGFCAALSHLAAFADEFGDIRDELTRYANRWDGLRSEKRVSNRKDKRAGRSG